MTTVVRTYKDNGPYWDATKMSYKAHSLKDLIFHIRQAMEDNEDYIAVWQDGQCKGIWYDDSEPEPDGEGGWYWPRACYVLMRPSASHFSSIVPFVA